MSGARGCGRRKANGIYLEVNQSIFGQEIDFFLVCPPVKVDADALGLSNIGVKLIDAGLDGKTNEGRATFNVWDIIGQSYYPNVADFIEEARRMGISRRLPATLDFSKITPESRLILLHHRAYVENHEEWFPESTWTCPKNIEGHSDMDKPQPMCCGIWWHDVEGCEVVPRRVTPSCAYAALSRPDRITPEYSLAIFASLPVGRIVVIEDLETGAHEKTMEKASASKLKVELERE